MLVRDNSKKFACLVDEQQTPDLRTLVDITNVVRMPGYGGNGGSLFDSGVNPSGVAKVQLELGYFSWFSALYPHGCKSPHVCVVKRFHVSFRDGMDTSHAIYHGQPVDQEGENARCVFSIPRGDSISSISIWSDQYCVNAIHITLASGVMSPMFGTPSHSASMAVINTQNQTVLGIHGRYGGVMDKLGFTIGNILGKGCVCSFQEEDNVVNN